MSGDTLTADLARIGGGSPETLADLRSRYHAAYQRAREQLALIDSSIVEHIEANGGKPIRVSDELELRAVTDKTTKCVDNERAAYVLIHEVGGDILRFAQFLAAGAFKPGACKSVLDPGVYSRLFTTEVKTKLESGAPKRRLALVNPKLLPAGSNHEWD